MNNQEFTYNYGYGDIGTYAFYSGFVPNIYELDCIKVKLLNEIIAK